MTTAFVFSGGGSHGAVQAGMLLALEEQGIMPDLVIGSSAGAMNAAFIAGRPYPGAAQELVDAWRQLRRKDIMPSSFTRSFVGIIGRSNHLVSPVALRQFVERSLTFERIEDAPIKLTCLATDLLTGAPVEITTGNAVDAIAASAALPGVYPPVEIGGRMMIDGGVTNNVPVSSAVAAGARTIYVLPAGHACSLSEAPRGALHVLFHSMSVLVHERLSNFAESYDGDVEVKVLPILCPVHSSILDFSKSSELIERAYSQSRDWLEGGDEAVVERDGLRHGHH